MKTLLLLFYIVFMGVKFCTAQVLDMRSATNWKIYDVHLHRNQFSLDTLEHCSNIPLSQDTMSMFLKNSASWPKEKQSVWMGYFACSADFPNGKTDVIIVSQYGGFFYDVTNKQYYAVSEDAKMDWTDYFVQKRAQLYMQDGVTGTAPIHP